MLLANLANGDVTANRDGTFRVGGLMPDTPIELQADLDGRLSDIVTIRVGPGMEQTTVVLRMQ